METACPHAVNWTDETNNGRWAGRLQKFRRVNCDACRASVSDAGVYRLQIFSFLLLPSYFLFLPGLFRFSFQREMTGQGIKDLRIPERPRIINRYSIETPLVAIARHVAIVAIHQ